jgi:TRAP transporter 4TM/12TM fusion protein
VPISPERLAAYLAFDSNGLMSRLLFIAAGTIAPFVIFGTLFARLGADRAIAEPLLYLMRNCVGGPSKAAVLSSTAFGLVSGSAVANVSTSAPITVPMMLRDRISRAEAAGIEAVASSVGQVMPPVMGASAFLMAEWLGRPYRDIVLAATVPALLCVVFLILIVDFDARRRAASEAAPPPIAPPVTALPWAGLVRVVLPLVALGFALFHGGIAPGRAALMATALVVALHLALPGGGRPAARVSAILAAAQASVPAITGVMLLTAMAALVMALLQVSGASFMLTQRLIDLSQGSFALLALLTTALVLFLGLGMPTIGVYVLAASLCAPVLAAGGTDPLAAHLFILFVGMLSMVTPPVAMASLTAAMIAGAPLWRTCAHGMRFGAGLTLVAAAILIQPALVAPLDDPRFMAAVLPLMLALGLVAAALAGHVGFAVGAAGRLVMLAAALAALSAMASAEVGPAWWLTLAIGASLLAVQTAAGRRMLGTIVARRRPS